MKRKFDDWIKAYIEFTSHSEAPPHFHYWTGVSTIAGALRRRVHINMGYFKWYPNFFIFFVAPPGIVAKSTTADIGMSILEEIESINLGPAATSWQALIKRLSESREDMPDGAGGYTPMSAITIVASELGTFLDPGNREMIDVLVSLWDGKTGTWEKLTKQDGEEGIVNPWINIIGCTTPSWVAENITEYFSGGGFASRSIFVYAEKKHRLVAYPHLFYDEKIKSMREDLLHDLNIIASLDGEYKLNDEALQWGTQWYSNLSKGSPHLIDEKFMGYLARKQTHLHKLSIVIAASRRNDLVITREDMEYADTELLKIEAEMPKVYRNAGREKESYITDEIIIHIQKHTRITKHALYREFMRKITYETFEKCLNSIYGAGLVDYIQDGNVVYISMVEENQNDVC